MSKSQRESFKPMSHMADIAMNIKTAAAVSIGTAAAGISSWIDLIPNNIGKLASLVGIFLSFVLIIVHLHGAYIKHKEYKRKQDTDNDEYN